MFIRNLIKSTFLIAGMLLASASEASTLEINNNNPIHWSVGPGRTLQTSGTIVKMKMISYKKAEYLLTGHGDLKSGVFNGQEGEVPAVKIELDNHSYMWYAFLGQNYAPWTEPLKLKLHQKVWVRSRADWPAIRVFLQKTDNKGVKK